MTTSYRVPEESRAEFNSNGGSSPSDVAGHHTNHLLAGGRFF
jgi:hypothetical protein